MRIHIQEENHSLTHFNIAHCAPFYVIRISRTVLNEWLFLSFPFQGPQKCQDTESIDTNRISIRNRCKISSYKEDFAHFFSSFFFLQNPSAIRIHCLLPLHQYLLLPMPLLLLLLLVHVSERTCIAINLRVEHTHKRTFCFLFPTFHCSQWT